MAICWQKIRATCGRTHMSVLKRRVYAVSFARLKFQEVQIWISTKAGRREPTLLLHQRQL